MSTSEAQRAHAGPGTGVALRIREARSFRDRLVGLSGVQPFVNCDALHLPRCRAIHTIGMAIAIDVIFVDRAQRVLRICAALGPGRLRWCRAADAVWELPAGFAHRLRLQVGDKFEC